MEPVNVEGLHLADDGNQPPCEAPKLLGLRTESLLAVLRHLPLSDVMLGVRLACSQLRDVTRLPDNWNRVTVGDDRRQTFGPVTSLEVTESNAEAMLDQGCILDGSQVSCREVVRALHERDDVDVSALGGRKQYPRLQALQVDLCVPRDFRSLTLHPQLRYLNMQVLNLPLRGYEGSMGLFDALPHLANLRTLILSGMWFTAVRDRDVRMDKFIEYLQTAPHLRKLCLQVAVEARVVTAILENCEHLERLTLGAGLNEEAETLGVEGKVYPRLTSFKLGRWSLMTDRTLGPVAAAFPSLRSLGLRLPPAVTDCGVRALLRQCRHLVSLSLTLEYGPEVSFTGRGLDGLYADGEGTSHSVPLEKFRLEMDSIMAMVRHGVYGEVDWPRLWRHTPRLRSFALHGLWKVFDDDLEPLPACCRGLEVLELVYCRSHDVEAVYSLAQALPRLHTLRCEKLFTRSAVGDVVTVPAASPLPHLQYLTVLSPSVRDRTHVETKTGNFRQLTAFTLTDVIICHLDKTLENVLKNCPELQELHLLLPPCPRPQKEDLLEAADLTLTDLTLDNVRTLGRRLRLFECRRRGGFSPEGVALLASDSAPCLASIELGIVNGVMTDKGYLDRIVTRAVQRMRELSRPPAKVVVMTVWPIREDPDQFAPLEIDASLQFQRMRPHPATDVTMSFWVHRNKATEAYL